MTLAHDTIANTIAGRLDLIRQNESLRAQLARCAAARVNLERRVLELTHEHGTEYALESKSETRWRDLAGLFIWSRTPEGWNYWNALACGNGLS